MSVPEGWRESDAALEREFTFDSFREAIVFVDRLADYTASGSPAYGGIVFKSTCAGCHGATDLSPVSMAAALHFDLSVNNFGIQEYMRHTEETDAVFPHAYTFGVGLMHPGEAPGLGVDIDLARAAKYPYRAAYLPVNRLEDGTMFNW